MSAPTFTVVGAGLGGALAATSLAKAGLGVEVFEKRQDMRRHGAERGRSINLALSARGLHALAEVGLADAALQLAIPMRGRMMHDRAGRLSFQPYSKDPHEAIHSVSRAALNIALIDALETLSGVEVRFEHRCDSVDVAGGRATFVRTHHGDVVESNGEVLLGADGAFSAVRAALQRLDRFDYAQQYLAHGYKELTLPAATGGGFAMAENALHIWPRGRFMMIALPNLDRTFTCTIFWPMDGARSFATLTTPDDVRRVFAEEFPDAVDLMPAFAEDFFANPTGSLLTVRCGPWHVADKVVLLGDAAHAVVPFYGQGMNAAFEDCTVLMACIRDSGRDLAGAFARYYTARKVDADALADLAVENFVEMRDRVASRWFLAHKAIERMLHRLLARWFVPLYSMVSFSRVPYAEAVRRAHRQARWVRAMGVTFAAALLALVAAIVWRRA